MSKKSLTKALECKSGMGTLTKARFGAGMLLQHDDLNALSSYTQDLNRLLFRTLLGCGVMCGLVVTLGSAKNGKFTVSVAEGVALNASGDPIAVTTKQTLELDTQCDAEFPARLWVLLCARYKSCAPRESMCASDDNSPSVATRERYGYEVRVVRELPDGACGHGGDDALLEEKCRCANPDSSSHKAHYLGNCSSGCDCTEGGSCGCGCDGGGCGCDCVVLARLDNEPKDNKDNWTVTHKVRRFIRPVLIEDPQVRIELDEAAKLKKNGGPAPAADDASKSNKSKAKGG
jgi:hypothetical protein